MQGEGILETIAEVSVAFAGFTGVVAAFGRRGGEGWSAADILRFTAMLGASLSALLYSVLPFVLHHLGFSETATWRLGSTLLFVQIIILFAGRFYRERQRQLTADGIAEASRGLVVLIAVLAAIVGVVQALNAAGAFPDRSFGAYLVGLSYFLIVSSIMFVRLVLPTVSR